MRQPILRKMPTKTSCVGRKSTTSAPRILQTVAARTLTATLPIAMSRSQLSLFREYQRLPGLWLDQTELLLRILRFADSKMMAW